MSNSSDKTTTKRKQYVVLFLVIFLVLFGVTQVAIRLNRPTFDPTVNVTEIPIPDDVAGPYTFKACLSPDGNKMVVSGNKKIPFVIDNVSFSDFVEPLLSINRGYCEAFQQNIFVASYPPKNKNAYNKIVHLDTCSTVLALAISNMEPKQLAFLVRETVTPIPSDFATMELNNLKKYFSQMEEIGVNVVLYTVPLDGGVPRKIIVIEENQPIRWIFRNQFTSSICWKSDDTGILYSDTGGVYDISFSGEKKNIYKVNAFQILTSFLYSLEKNSVSFIVMEFKVPINDLENKPQPWPDVCGYWTRIDYKGNVLEHKPVPSMAPSNDRGSNFAVMNHSLFIWPRSWLGADAWAKRDIPRQLFCSMRTDSPNTSPKTTLLPYKKDREEKCLVTYNPMFITPDNKKVVLLQSLVTMPDLFVTPLAPSSLVEVPIEF